MTNALCIILISMTIWGATFYCADCWRREFKTRILATLVRIKVMGSSLFSNDIQHLNFLPVDNIFYLAHKEHQFASLLTSTLGDLFESWRVGKTSLKLSSRNGASSCITWDVQSRRQVDRDRPSSLNWRTEIRRWCYFSRLMTKDEWTVKWMEFRERQLFYWVDLCKVLVLLLKF